MSEKSNEQAATLEKLFNEIQEDSEQEPIKKPVHDQQSVPKIDVLNLPPRKEVHGGSDKRMVFKINRPLRRLLFVCILLLIIGVVSYFLWGENLELFLTNF